MAKQEKPKANAKLAQATAKIVDETSVRDTGNNLPTSEQLAKHMAKFKELAAESAEVRGDMGALVKDGEDTLNIHRKAFKFVATIEKMDETKRNEFLRHFFHYLEARQLYVTPGLFDGAGGDEARPH